MFASVNCEKVLCASVGHIWQDIVCGEGRLSSLGLIEEV